MTSESVCLKKNSSSVVLIVLLRIVLIVEVAVLHSCKITLYHGSVITARWFLIIENKITTLIMLNGSKCGETPIGLVKLQ